MRGDIVAPNDVMTFVRQDVMVVRTSIKAVEPQPFLRTVRVEHVEAGADLTYLSVSRPEDAAFNSESDRSRPEKARVVIHDRDELELMMLAKDDLHGVPGIRSQCSIRHLVLQALQGVGGPIPIAEARCRRSYLVQSVSWSDTFASLASPTAEQQAQS